MEENTIRFKVIDNKAEIKEILSSVYHSLVVKGYNPINQMVGYIISGDPTYITSFDNSRGKITRINRDEIVEELLRSFVEHHNLDQKNGKKSDADSGC